MSVSTAFQIRVQHLQGSYRLISVDPGECTTLKDIQATCLLFFSASVWHEVTDRPCDSADGAIVDVVYDVYTGTGRITVTSLATALAYTAIVPYGRFRQQLTTAQVGDQQLLATSASVARLYQELLKTPNYPDLNDGISIPVDISFDGHCQVILNHTKAVVKATKQYTGWLHGIVEVLDTPDLDDALSITATVPGRGFTHTLYRKSTRIGGSVYTFMVCIPDVRDVIVAGRDIRALDLTFIPWVRPSLYPQTN